MTSWLLAGWLAISVAACEEDVAPRTRPSEVTTGSKPNEPLSAQTIASVKLATAAATRLAKSIAQGKPSRVDYLALRRSAAAAEPFARQRAEVGGEVLWGPPKAADEAGGALTQLDRALASGDLTLATKHVEQCVRALRLIDNEIMLHSVSPDRAVQALSDASFRLGLMLMEAQPGVADAPDAVLADLLGTLDGIDHGVSASLAATTAAKRDEARAPLDALQRESGALRRVLDGATDSHALQGRARLVLQTGRLGVAARRFALALGVKPTMPYLARYPRFDNDMSREVITPLTVPAPRRDLRPGDTPAIAELGRALFDDRRLSKGAVRACSDCHQRSHGLTDGLAVPSSLDPATPIERNTPTLFYSPLHAAQLWDGRFASAERQAIKVIHAKSEMGLDAAMLVQQVGAVAAYNATFSLLFDDGVTAANIARALVAFQISELVPASAPIDRFGRGDEGALDATELLGFDVFVGVGRCARCHVPPLFGGSRPTDFATPIYAAIGVPVSPDDKRLDPDRGRGGVTKQPLDEHAFKTPTVRNVSLTAPYFHNGAYPTLEQVVDFYVAGGPAGLGFSVKNLDPDVRKLDLNEQQKAALLAFLRVGLLDRQPK